MDTRSTTDDPVTPDSTAARKHRRAYKACISCRKRKARCDLGGRDGPPCTKCRRELRECVFTSERSWTKSQKPFNARSPSSSPKRHQQADSVSSSRADRPSASPKDHTQSASPAQQRRPNDAQLSPRPDLMDNVRRTVVSSGNEALDLLFEAAQRQDDIPRSREASPLPYANRQARPSSTRHSFDATAMWQRSKFVRLIWLSAEDIVLYIDFFVKHMMPMSPVLCLPADYEGTHRMIASEPLLCVAILMISSRYCDLPGQGSASRGHWIHERMWTSCQQLISRIVFGQERGPLKRARSIGSIEALLLLTEYHPRGLHFAPPTDGWESDAILDDQPSSFSGPPNSWIQDVIEPSRRSDRMSWMLIGAAMSLGFELGLFSEDQTVREANADLQQRKRRIKSVLYILVVLIGSRFGCTSLPQSMSRVIKSTVASGADHDGWEPVVLAWTDLTRLQRTIGETVFPSKAHTQQILRNNSYMSFLEHYDLMLRQWEEKHLSIESLFDVSIQKIQLCIEYRYIRMFTMSLAMQAVCERASTETDTSMSIQETVDESEAKPIQDVIHNTCALLEHAGELARRQLLKLSPVRVYLRIVTAAIFLLKALGIVVRHEQLRRALELLENTVRILRDQAADDMHLAARYADLLEAYVSQLRTSFSSHLRQTTSGKKTSLSESGGDREAPARIEAIAGTYGEVNTDLNSLFDNYTSDHLLSLPFDPTMAPLFPLGGPSDGEAANVGVEDDGFPMMWNMG